MHAMEYRGKSTMLFVNDLKRLHDGPSEVRAPKAVSRPWRAGVQAYATEPLETSSPRRELITIKEGVLDHPAATPVSRAEMVGRGWLAEGDGPDKVLMCAPA
jgi:hypothetical protein